MRHLAIVFFCLAVAGGSAAAQSVAEPAPPSTPKPVEQSAAQPVAQPVASPAEQSVVQQAVASVEKTAAQPDAKPDAKPVEQTGALPAAQPITTSCPGNPQALGTSRVLTVTPDEFGRIGTIQYKRTLPLKDHEVVLTFDDGPIPPSSNIILDTLDSQCVKATYFMVGEMAHAYPAIVRRIYNAGHTIGTHTQHHPFAFQNLSMQGVEREVDGGIASVDAALGDPKAVAPFFRIPGLGRTNAIEQFLQGKGLLTWSADIDTNDWWRGTSPSQIVQRAMRRLNAKGRGILLMHDIHPATALALPALLKELKSQGYHVVQVVASGERPALPELVAAPAEDKGNWPRVLKTSARTSSDEAPLRHRIKKAPASDRAALRHRIKKSIASDEPALRHRIKKSIASNEPALRHRIKKSIASNAPALRHRIKSALASKRRPAAVASVPAPDSAASRNWQRGQF
jgi:peptidoglycan/xylan/chitin deacetylase (PgdA/CDA1 family)